MLGSGSKKETPMKENRQEMRPAGLSSGPRVKIHSSNDIKKEVEVGEASFRVYYGATGAAVPFMWESQPGTPKHPIFDKSKDNIVPPLTPPPSYKSSSPLALASSSSSSRNSRKPWLLSTFFSSISRRRSMSHVTPTSSLSSSSSSSSYHIRSFSTSSSSSSPSLTSPHLAGGRKRLHHTRSASSLCFPGHQSPLLEEDDRPVGPRSPPSTMCFGFTKKQGCYLMEDVKKTILSI